MKSQYKILIFILLLASAAYSRVDSNIKIYASVSNEKNEYIKGLNKEDFQVFVNDKPQKIINVSSASEEISIGFIVNQSKWLGIDNFNYNSLVRMFVNAFEKSGFHKAEKSEYFLVGVREKPVLISAHSSDFALFNEALSQSADFEASKGAAYRDAVLLGLHELRKSTNRKILIVLGNGTDDKSISNSDQMLKAIQRDDTLIYRISNRFVDTGPRLRSPLPPAAYIDDMVSISGGREFMIWSLFDSPTKIGEVYMGSDTNELITKAFQMLAEDVETRHSIEFELSGAVKADKFNKLKIKVVPHEIIGRDGKTKKVKLEVTHRSGFYPSIAN